jgi:hypothetical protein
MKIGRQRLLVFVLAIGLVAAWVWNGQAKSGGKKRLRTEIAQLRAELAQVKSSVDFQQRRDTAIGFPGTGGLCGDPCSEDSDGDRVNDCEDPCPCDASNSDGDGDGAIDCIDPCPDDATDACIDPCRMDSDGDGVNDCEDPCPWDPAPATDGDGDGVADCMDPCPDDPDNACIGPCPLMDQDGDGMRDCIDPCPWGEQLGMPCVWGKGGETTPGGVPPPR